MRMCVPGFKTATLYFYRFHLHSVFLFSSNALVEYISFSIICDFIILFLLLWQAGRIAAAWNQFQAQEKLVACAAKHGVALSLFHGKGGTASRGGDPSTFRAICAQPPGTVSGQFRITEQGEIITQNYSHPPVAERHLGIYTAALVGLSLV